MYSSQPAGAIRLGRIAQGLVPTLPFYLLPMARSRKQIVMTFKADAALRQALRGVDNRSEFIRSAILAAMDNVCPLCKGSGILSTDQRKHWDRFAQDHQVEECGDCHAVHLVCRRRGASSGQFDGAVGAGVATDAAEAPASAAEQPDGLVPPEVGNK